MIKWRTPVQWPSDLDMSHDDLFLFMGSCFSENISEKMRESGFMSLSNPLGIMYNAASIERSLDILLGTETLSANKFLSRSKQVFHYDLHSSLHAEDKSDLISKVEEKRKELKAFLESHVENTEQKLFVFITLGTAWAYKDLASEEYVANCHKQPTVQFEKTLMSEKEIVDYLLKILGPRPHKNTNYILTVSPVRHLKDGMVENQQSKSRLISAVHKVVSEKNNVSYFPAYEIMMDDLRDYRYYSDDLLHPNKQAIDYIWSIFAKAYFDNVTNEIRSEYTKLKQMSDHRPLFPESEEAIHFEKKLRSKKLDFLRKHPNLSFEI